nr:MAG TPA: Endonuclease [Caudoviricetes sp.]
MTKEVKIVRGQNKSYNKYGNKKVIVDGHKFDSQKEALRYKKLKLMERAGVIKDLELQPTFELIPTIRTEHETLRKTIYKADFKYFDVNADHEVVEDVKGFKTDVYKLKKKMLLHKYKDIDFREV